MLVGSTSEIDWKYLNNTQSEPASGMTSGTLTFTMPAAPGNYQFKLHEHYGYTVLATSPSVTVVSGAPTITTQPSAATVNVGQNAAFSVTATGGSLTYQWRRNGVNISGATSASYTLSNAQSSDNGALFSVVVSNGSGSVTSANATLTVNNPTPVTLLTWDFATSAGGQTSSPSTSNASGIQTSSMTRGSGFSPAEATYTGNTIGYFNYHQGTGPANLAAAQSANHYIQFTVAGTSGKTVSLTNLKLYSYTQDGGVSLTVHYSLDGFATAGTQVFSGPTADGWTGSLSDINLGSVSGLQGVTGTVTFRVYFHGAFSNGYVDRGLGGVAGSNADVQVTGTVTP
jgi:hypothetical protein